MKRKFRKILGVGMALALLTSMLVTAAPVAATVGQPEVTVDVAIPAASATSYTIVFTTNEDLTTAAGDTITIEFPDGTANDTDISGIGNTDVEVGGTPATSVSIAGTRLSITPDADVAAGEVTVIISNSTITNPDPMGDDYTLDVYTSQEPTRVTSETYIIGEELVSVAVATAPDTVDTASEYIITFEVTTALTTAAVDTITITFPDDTYVPGTIPAAGVYVEGGSGETVSTVAPTVVGRTVTVTIPTNVAASATRTVRFSVAVGIRNPTTFDNPDPATNTWTLTMYTSQDIVPVESSDYGSLTEAEATAITKLVVINVDTYVLNDTFSDVMYIEAQDEYGNPTSVDSGSTITVTLSASPSGGYFYDAGGEIITTVEIPADDTKSGDFKFKSAPATSTTYAIAGEEDPDQGWTHVSSDLTVSPKVELWGAGTKIGDYTSFTAAIAAAVPYDTIKAPAGTYEEDFAVNKANLTIESTAGKASTFLIGVTGGQDGIVQINHGVDNFVLGGASGKGFTLQEGGWHIHFTGDSTDVIISYNTLDFTGNEGVGGIQMWGGTVSGLTVIENTFILADLYDTGVRGNFNATLVGLTVTNNTFTGVGSTLDHIAIEINDLDISSEDSTISGNDITGVKWGVVINGQSGSKGLIVGEGTPGTLEISGNTFDALIYGIDLINVDGGAAQNVVIERNTFTNNNYGLNIRADNWVPADFTVQYNDFSGNTYGIYNDSTGTTVLDATYNYWGDATGPGDDDIGTGDSDIVISTPWLHKSYTFVVADNADYPAFSRSLAVGWNTLSVPGKLIEAADALNELVPAGMTVAYKYDGGWVQITTDVINPLDGIYIKMASAQTVLLQVDGAAFSVPTKSLAAGWNLIGLASLTTKTDEEATASLSSANFGLMVSPSLNASEWIYIGDSFSGNLAIGEGYWIFMKSAATIAGFTILPMAPSLN